MAPEETPPASVPESVQGLSQPSVTPAPPEPASQQEDTGFSFDDSGADTGFSFDDQPATDTAAKTGSNMGSADEFDWQDGFDLNATGSEPAAPSSVEPTAASASAADFSLDSDFDFGDSVAVAPADAKTSPAPPAAASAIEDDFSLDFGDVSFSEPATAKEPTAAASADDDFSFDTGSGQTGGDFSVSFDSEATMVASSPVVMQPPAAAYTKDEEQVNFGEFSFGEEPEPESKADIPMAGAAMATAAVAAGAAAAVAAGVGSAGHHEGFDEEPPPAAITTRKKHGGFFPVIIILGAVVLLLALIGSAVYFFSGPKAFSKVGLGFLVEWSDKKGAEEGSIVLRNITATYVNNSAAGELFVVRGEAVNNFKKPRASVQIKVTLLGGGASLLTKSAYCGNSLSAEQLSTLPLAKLDEIMNNQFGDSLVNLGLKPGAAIPFVVAVSQVPKNASDYSVQVAGSTVAAQ